MFWDGRYGEEGFAYGTTPNNFLVEHSSRLAPSSKVLCLAEGEGRNGVYLAQQGHDVTGVDSSKVGLDKAQKLANQNGVTITTVVADLREYDIGEAQWDAVVSIFCHMPVPMRKNVHSRAVRGLKPGGVLILEAYTPKQLEMGTGGPHTKDLLMTLEEIQAEDFAGLELDIGREVDRDVIEGKYHTGKAAVVQFVGRKPIGM
mmetsp:Transcript_11191/g.18600  ORF Transcript_11191/g.18600 Transcript_11191/m.18600 type:complete len:202 (+) Transcript_11191:114-719(+)|eukprot:CAMPEP_0197719832 /NCGR_PEP_ID=MMETSP1434-20131217/3421_1 /TAXON_ID=265543 /ORGANISM="Minutocellus polymorphus, Strain CCMP3303" /LENGTH=201 /DNA_ID=CAMNT_0043304615 /DNA_START=113 /DNA_END=718 /DNA_ORIENTATION=+